jgi:hypothetical protein
MTDAGLVIPGGARSAEIGDGVQEAKRNKVPDKRVPRFPG